jgi:hypothetical protein
MDNLKHKCNSILKDPFYKGSICNKEAKYMIKLKDEKDYIHPRCGTHSKKEDKIELYAKKKKNIIDKKQEKVNESDNNKNNFNLDELLKYIESDQYRKDIPQEIQDLFNDIDKLNNNIEKILK